MKHGDKFNAYGRIKNNLARGCPCTFVRANKKSTNADYIIYATCKDLSPNPGPDVKRTFSAADFKFEVLK